jgi:FRG domain
MPYKVKTVSEFLKTVSDIQNEWTGLANDELIFPWFRGHANSSYLLTPGLYRASIDPDNEYSYRSDFMLKALPFLSDTTFINPSSDWDWYFLMQHYGLPTRLLDWSEGSLIALYFALFYKREDDEENPCVWMLHPFEFNRCLHKRDEILFYNHELVKPYIPALYSGASLPKSPMAIQPSYNSKRIVVQKGCFTIHGDNKISLEKIPALKNCLVKIEIEYYYIDLIKDELIMTGVTESSLFPELGGLARELLQYWRQNSI